MKTLIQLFELFGRALFGRLPFCSMPGAGVGAFAGVVLGIVMVQEPGLAVTFGQLVVIGAILGVVGFLMVLLLLGVWLHYGVAAIALPAFVNAILTGVLSVLIVHALRVPAIAAFLGAAVGAAIGAVLCGLCPWLSRGSVGSHA